MLANIRDFSVIYFSKFLSFIFRFFLMAAYQLTMVGVPVVIGILHFQKTRSTVMK